MVCILMSFFFFYRNYSFYTLLHLSFHLACMFHIAKHDVQMILYKALVLHFVQNNAQTLEQKILQARILENTVDSLLTDTSIRRTRL